MPLQHRPAGLDAARADTGRDILLEGLVEGAALAAVKGQNPGVLGDAAEGLRNHPR
jgi:hypothetical protein